MRVYDKIGLTFVKKSAVDPDLISCSTVTCSLSIAPRRPLNNLLLVAAASLVSNMRVQSYK